MKNTITASLDKLEEYLDNPGEISEESRRQGLTFIEAQFGSIWKELVESLREKTGFSQYMDLRYIHSRYEKALAACRAGSFEMANLYFKEGTKLSAHIGLENLPLVHSFSLPVYAYHAYKNGDYEKALALLDETMVADTYIETEFNYPVWHLHKVQMTVNKAKVYARQDEAAYFRIVPPLLQYVKNNQLPAVEGDWNTEQLTSISDIHKGQQVAQLMFEAAHKVIHTCAVDDNRDIDQLYETCFGDLNAGGRPEAGKEYDQVAILDEWLRLQNEVFLQDSAQYIEESIDFLENGDAFDVFKAFILLGCIKIAGRESADAVLLTAKIHTYWLSRLRLPRHYANVLAADAMTIS